MDDSELETFLKYLQWWSAHRLWKMYPTDPTYSPEQFEYKWLPVLARINPYHPDLRIAEVLLAFNFWIRQRGAERRLYPAGKPIGLKAAKVWFGARLEIILREAVD